MFPKIANIAPGGTAMQIAKSLIEAAKGSCGLVVHILPADDRRVSIVAAPTDDPSVLAASITARTNIE